MKRAGLFAFAAAILVLAVHSPALAQEAPGTVGQVILVDPMPGHATALEEGAREHLAWYTGAGGGTWQWAAFEIVMGERTGQYMWGTFNHNYADWDAPDVDQQASDRSIDRNIAPHVQDVTVSLLNLRPELSLIDPEAGVFPLYEVITFKLNNGMVDEFEHALQMIKKGLETVGARYFVYQYAQGGPGNTWVVSIPYESFGSMGAMNDEGFWSLMSQVHGEFGSRMVQELLDTAIASTTSEMFAHRPDLSANLPPT